MISDSVLYFLKIYFILFSYASFSLLHPIPSNTPTPGRRERRLVGRESIVLLGYFLLLRVIRFLGASSVFSGYPQILRHTASTGTRSKAGDGKGKGQPSSSLEHPQFSGLYSLSESSGLNLQLAKSPSQSPQEANSLLL